jgi:glutathione S-transferase
MRLFQIPFSHNCIKARHVLDLKGLSYETVDINPALRGEVKRISGQALVPVLVDRGHVVSGSTEIALYLDQRHPDPPLLPDDPQERAECLILTDWADAAFMALTRRLAYFQVLSAPGQVGQLFFPAAAPQVQRVAGAGAAQVLRLRFGISAERNRRDEEHARRVTRIALERPGGGEHLVGDRLSLADITLATMAAPLQYAGRGLRDDAAVRELLEWGARTLGAAFSPLPVPEPAPTAT